LIKLRLLLFLLTHIIIYWLICLFSLKWISRFLFLKWWQHRICMIIKILMTLRRSSPALFRLGWRHLFVCNYFQLLSPVSRLIVVPTIPFISYWFCGPCEILNRQLFTIIRSAIMILIEFRQPAFMIHFLRFKVDLDILWLVHHMHNVLIFLIVVIANIVVVIGSDLFA